jgi:integrase
MASLSLLKNWLDDALLPFLRQDSALAAETLEAFGAVWPEDVLARSALVGAWLDLLEEASEDEAPALREKLEQQHDFILAAALPAGWLSAWNRARFFHLCRARPALAAERSQPALLAAFRDVNEALAFSPFDFHAQATKVRLLRALGQEPQAFALTREVQWLLPGFTGLKDVCAEPTYLAWRERARPPVKPFVFEPALPAALARTLPHPRKGDVWQRARDAALAALALELGVSPAELTRTHPAQLDPWRGRFLRLGSETTLSPHTLTLTLLRHWLVVARNHPRLRGGPRRYLFPDWEEPRPLRPLEVGDFFLLPAFPREPAEPRDESGAIFGPRSMGHTSRIHRAFPEVEPDEREDVVLRTPRDLQALLPRLGSGRVRHLSLHGEVGARGLARLADVTGASQLRSLHLLQCDVGPEGARVLAMAPAFAGLRELVLDGNPLGPEGLAALVDGPALGQLRSLSLRGCQLGPEGVDRLGRSALVRRLRVLDLGDNAPGEGLRSWASREGPWALEVLGLGRNPTLEGHALAAWLRSRLAANLRWLDVQHGVLGDVLLEALADSEHLGRLAVLDAGRNALSAGGLEALAKRTPPLPLVWLGLGGNRLGPQGTLALAQAPCLRRVTHLGLASTDATPEALLASEHLGQLVSLELGDNGLPGDIAERFFSCPRLPRLERLSLATHTSE